MSMFKIQVVTPPRNARKSFVQRYVVQAQSAENALALFMVGSNTLPGDEVLVFACDGNIVYCHSSMEWPADMDDLRADVRLSHKVAQ